MTETEAGLLKGKKLSLQAINWKLKQSLEEKVFKVKKKKFVAEVKLDRNGYKR